MAQHDSDSNKTVCDCTHTQACEVCAESKGIDWKKILPDRKDEVTANAILGKHTGEEGIYLTKGMIRVSDALEAMEEYASRRIAEVLSKAGEQLPDEQTVYSIFEHKDPDSSDRVYSAFEDGRLEGWESGAKMMKEKATSLLLARDLEIEIMKESVDDVVNENLAMKRLINKFNHFLDTFGTVFPGNSDEKEAMMQRELFDEARKYTNHYPTER